jgi:hypothetical protein
MAETIEASMLSVIHPGWLLLLICTIILLLVGCSVIPTRTPVPSSTPLLNITLTVLPSNGTPQPRSTRPFATPRAYSDGFLMPPGIASSPPPEKRLHAEAPTCTSSPGGYSCLGRVWNYGTVDVHDVTLRVQLRDGDSTLEQLLTPEQRLIPAGGFAPYRLMFRAGQLQPVIESAAHSNPAPDLVPLTVIDERGIHNQDGQYIITTRLRNDSSTPVHLIRLIATVVDGGDHVVGYRVFEQLQQVNVGDNMMFRLEIVPQVGEIVGHILHAEGQRSH